MRWDAIFDDNEGLDSIRKERSTAHFEYLSGNRDKIVIAGGLRPAPGDWYCTFGSGSARAIACSCGARLLATVR